LDPESDEKSRRRARWWWWATGIVVVGLVLWVLATGGESDRGNQITAPRDFCTAAGRYEKTVERQHEDGQDELSPAQIDRQVVLAQAIVDTAPRKVLPDAETFLSALRRAQDARKTIEGTPAEQAAVRSVNSAFAQGCGIYARDSGI